jgi:hypothetical protein
MRAAEAQLAGKRDRHVLSGAVVLDNFMNRTSYIKSCS